jgi:hypothetical protein
VIRNVRPLKLSQSAVKLIRKKRFWIIVTIAFIVASWVATPFLRDYRRTVFLRSQVRAIPLGSNSGEIVEILGQPDTIWRQPDSSVVLVYCSRFDWDGVRSRWDDQPFLEYWLTRLSGEIDEQRDSVIKLTMRDGVLENIENAVSENLIGYNPTLKF